MKKYAKIVNEETKACIVGDGTKTDFYQHLGMVEMDVEESHDGFWYVQGYAPKKPALTKEEVDNIRKQLYTSNVDPLMSEYNRKKVFGLFDDGEEEKLLAEIKAVVSKIQNEHPYPVSNINME